jgi:hypothetical protein
MTAPTKHQGLDIIEHVDEGEVLAYSHRKSLLADDTLFVRHSLSSE